MTTSPQTGPYIYTDQQVQAGIQELFSNNKFVWGMRAFLPEDLFKHIISVKDSVRNSYEFQKEIIRPFLQLILKTSSTGSHTNGLSHLDPDKKYLFISNHRDIGLDSAFVNFILFESEFSTSQIAIGDNLMKHRVAELIFRINKTFDVKRTGSPRELYHSSTELSNYISRTITSRKDSIWIAQKEGRAKDGNDRTQLSLIKMLGLCGEEDRLTHFSNLNIVPVSISYEYDPCDYLKTKEYVNRLKNSNYTKTFDEDINSIIQGMKGQKGNIQINFGTPIAPDIELIDSDLKPKQVLEKIVSMIDRQVHLLYQMNPINYVAFDLLEKDHRFKDKYSASDKELVSIYFKNILNKFSKENRETAEEYLLGIYANPLKNQLTFSV